MPAACSGLALLICDPLSRPKQAAGRREAVGSEPSAGCLECVTWVFCGTDWWNLSHPFEKEAGRLLIFCWSRRQMPSRVGMLAPT